MSPGQAVKAMILNGLGFLSAPLYLFEQFFLGKATELLVGQGVETEQLNDSRLGRVLDKLYQANVTQVFLKIALKAYEKFGVNSQVLHLDSTSFHVHGAYEVKGDGTVASEPTCFLKVADGNEGDQAAFAGILKEFQDQWTMGVKVYVADAALYTASNLSALGKMPWISRVPATLKEAKTLMTQGKAEEMQESGLTGYRSSEHSSDYGDVPQRWILVESAERRKADLLK